jgi:SRSO17 transposase
VRQYVLPAMRKQGPIEAWIIDDTGLVKRGTHSVGVTRQYCGQVGKQENCRVAVSLSICTAWIKEGKQAVKMTRLCSAVPRLL